MKLTGKCLQEFKGWYQKQNFQINYDIDDQLCFMDGIPESMQFGVYVDFFDSVGIDITIGGLSPDRYMWQVDDLTCSNDQLEGESKTRHEARTKAINKANEIFNDRI